jgi:plasmid stabilization system protein ParE
LTWIVAASPAAETDIADAVDWYEERSPGLGRRFLSDIQSLIDRIADNPLQYALVYRDARHALLRRFPYALIFRIEENEVRVLACYHTSRNPRRWRARVRGRAG